MSSNLRQKRKFKEKLKDTYRIVVIDTEDLKEVGNYKFTMARLYTYIFSGLLVFSILLISFIAFTPLKRLMPGFGDIEENSKFIKLRKSLESLESELETQIVYTQGLQNMLSGMDPVEVPLTVNENTQEENTPNQARIIPDADVKESRITQPLNNQYFVPPITGNISAKYDRANNHLGCDILAPKDSAIKAIASGVVIGSDFTLDTGNTITIQHANNVISSYKHNSALLKKAGDRVNGGEAIAIIGNTGTLTDGPHLHFELWYDGNPVNPENFINFK